MGDAGTTRPTVLVCDDEPVLRVLVRAALDDGRCRVLEARDGDEPIERTRRDRRDLIRRDLMVPGSLVEQVLAA
jgi:CheY-like chemotaxis protein